MDGVDPGWPPVRAIAGAFLFFFVRNRTIDRAPNPLLGIRALFVQFVATLVLFGIVLAFLSSGRNPSAGTTVMAVVTVVVGVASLAARRAFNRPLDCTSDATLDSTYRTRFFLRVTFAQIPALVGFVGFFQAGQLWMYGLGCAFAAVGYVLAAPTRAQIVRDQHALDEAGCGRSLLAVLG